MKIFTMFRKEPVFAVSAVLALASAFVVHPSSKYIDYIDFKTLSCLLCLMIALKGLEREGLLDMVSARIAMRLSNARILALFLVFSCFFISMLMTNDVALIATVPITLTILVICQLEHWSAFIIVLQTIAANIGSSLTPIGNPQNLFLFTHFQMSLSEFILTMLPVVLVGAVMLAASCLFIPNEPLTSNLENRQTHLRPNRIFAYTVMFILSVLAVFDVLSHYLVLSVLILATFIIDKKTLSKVDYYLILTFIVIFIFVGNLAAIPLISSFLTSIIEKNLILSAIFTSQLTSNVPAAVLLSRFTNDARGLLLGVNVGGLGTLIASMASVISYKLYSNTHHGQTFRYLKVFTLWNVMFLIILALVALL